MTRIFVYGTLKRGHCNAHLLETGTAPGSKVVTSYAGVATTKPRYRMYNCGGYPGLVRETSGSRIQGELWEIDAEVLRRLHALEGVNEGLYTFEPIELEVGAREGQAPEERCYAYFYARSTHHLPEVKGNWPAELDYGRRPQPNP